MTHTPFVFLDIETTGMSPRTGGRVIEVGALRVEDHKVVARMDTLIDPQADIPYFITNITGIADEHVSSSPVFEDIVDELDVITKDAIFVAHNVNFDYGFIQHEYRQINRHFSMPRLCTVELSRAFFPFERGHSLSKIIERHGYTIANRHRAMDDARVLYQLYTDMLHQDPQKLFMHINRLIK